MKVCEITQLDEASIFDEHALINTKWTSMNHLRVWLKKRGFKKIGEGAFAEVYAKPNHKRVVKISTDQDMCWIKFAKWAMKQTSNRYLPNIPWVHLYRDEQRKKTFFVTIIERLKPCSPNQLRKITDLVVAVTILRIFDLDGDEYDALEKHVHDLFKEKFNIWSPTYKQVDNFVKEHTNHRFVKTLKRIESLGQSHCFDDLHNGNIMFRDDGTPVLTDPLAEM